MFRRKLKNLFSNAAKSHYKIGFALQERGRFRDAIVKFDKAIEINPNYKEAHLLRGLAYFKLKQYEQAIDNYSKLIEISPINAAYVGRGVVYADLKQFERAIADFSKAIELNPFDAEAYFCCGFAYVGLEQYERAKKELEFGLHLAEGKQNFSPRVIQASEMLRKLKQHSL